MGRVYSYLRFSAAKQADGASTARQTEYAKKWAEENNLVLDESLTMRDEGLSAYHQKHIKQGALGTFLAAITNGQIPFGSVLIVEGLDRLSRAEPILAQAQLAQIVNAGITVVTASDGRQYNRDSLKANPMDLVYSLLVMIRAHEESETKSKRVSDALLRAAKAWQAGQKVTVPGGRIPAWIERTTEGTFALIPEHAEAMREAIRLYLGGYGAVKILDSLKASGFALILQNRPNNLDQLFRHKSYLFLGNREMALSGEAFILERYYPALIDTDTYNRLQVESAKRKQRPHLGAGKSEVPNLFSGMGLCRCGACGSLIVSNSRKLKAPRGEYWYRRLRCPTCERKVDPSAPREPLSERYGAGRGSSTPDHLERAVFDYCADQFNLSSLLAGDDNGKDLREEQTALTSDIERSEKQLAKIVRLSLDGEGDIPAALVRQMQELERQIAAGKDREQQIVSELAVKATSKTVDAAAWHDLRTGFFALDHAARTAARKLFDDTFSGVRIFFQAKHPEHGTPALGLELTSKTGEQRLLIVDRKTGKMLDAIKTDVTENDAAVVVSATKLKISGVKH